MGSSNPADRPDLTDWLKKAGAALGIDVNSLPTGGTASNLPTTGNVMVYSGTQMVQPGWSLDKAPHQTGDWVPTSQAPMVPRMVPASMYLSMLDKYYNTIGYRPAYDQIAVQLRNAGYIAPWKSGSFPAFSTVRDAYSQMLTEASYNTNLTPEQFLQAKASAGFAEQQSKKKDGVGESQTSTDTRTENSSTVNFTDKFSAHALVDNALSTYLGRRATPTELSKFKAMLRETEAANPNVASRTTTTTQTITPNEDGTSSTSSTSASSDGETSGGVDGAGKAQIAKEFAQSRSDYAETTAATTGMKWFQDAIVAMNNGRMI